MKVDYNVDKSEITNSKGLENRLILDFLKSDNENMRFTYESNHRAKQRRACIAVFVKRMKLPCQLRVNGDSIYVLRNETTETV